MSRPSSSFLRGANANADRRGTLDEGAILGALGGRTQVSLMTLANDLKANPEAVREVLWQLKSRGYISQSEDERFTLSEAGLRALKYTKSAR